MYKISQYKQYKRFSLDYLYTCDDVATTFHCDHQ